MAVQSLLTINGQHRNIKQEAITIGGVYRNIKDAFITKGGVYRRVMMTERPMPRLEEMLRSAEIISVAGRNSASKGAVQLSLGDEFPVYALTIYNGSMSFSKFTEPGRRDALFRSHAGSGYITPSGYYSNTGDATSNVYGATLAALRFPGHKEAEIDAALRGIEFTGDASGIDSAAYASISLQIARDSEDVVFASVGSYFAAYIDGVPIFGTSTKPAVSVTATEVTYKPGSAHGASIICVKDGGAR